MFTLNCRGRILKIDEPVVMGIINSTPDSFYKGSRVKLTDEVLLMADKMIADGASILDIGGQSTRPGSSRLDADTELNRVMPLLTAIKKYFPDIFISIDSYYASVAGKAVEAGADIINDISSGAIDEELIPLISQLQVPYVLMHLPGKLENIQKPPAYKNVTLEVFDFLNLEKKKLTDAGLKDIIIDPGFGFGKSISHNMTMLRELSYFNQLGSPVLAGLSRKGMIYKTLAITPEEALNGTTVLHTLALQGGASILRAHDVKEAVQAIKLYVTFKKNNGQPV